MKLLLLVLLSVGCGIAGAATNVESLQARDWTTLQEGRQVNIRHTLSFKESGALLVKAECLFSERGLGRDLTAQVSAPIDLSETQIKFLENASATMTDKSTGNYCTAYVGKGFSDYKFFSADEVYMIGGLYSAVEVNQIAPPSIVGNEWTFTFNSNGLDLKIVQDFTVEGTLTTTATCMFPQPITVSVSAPVQVTDSQIINPRSATNKRTDENGNWCSALIPKRTMTYKMLSEEQVQVDNDPLHPEGIVWNLEK